MSPFAISIRIPGMIPPKISATIPKAVVFKRDAVVTSPMSTAFLIEFILRNTHIPMIGNIAPIIVHQRRARIITSAMNPNNAKIQAIKTTVPTDASSGERFTHMFVR